MSNFIFKKLISFSQDTQTTKKFCFLWIKKNGNRITQNKIIAFEL